MAPFRRSLRRKPPLSLIAKHCTLPRLPLFCCEAVLSWTSLCLALAAIQHACAPHEQRPGLFHPFIYCSGLPTSEGDLSPPSRMPGMGHPVCGLTCSLPRAHVCSCNLPFPLSPIPGAQVPIQLLCFPSNPITCVSFLQLGCTDVLLPVFSEDSSTCRCIFDVFGAGAVKRCALWLLNSAILISLQSFTIRCDFSWGFIDALYHIEEVPFYS